MDIRPALCFPGSCIPSQSAMAAAESEPELVVVAVTAAKKQSYLEY